MSKCCIHDFHLVIDRGMKKKLQNLDLYFNSKSLSGIIVKILKLLTPVLRKEHKWGEQRMSRYKAVCEDSEEIRENIHIYVPDDFYRELKLLHQDLNFYSIAQMIREFINFFLGLVDVYKNKVFTELERIFTRWRSEDKQTR